MGMDAKNAFVSVFYRTHHKEMTPRKVSHVTKDVPLAEFIWKSLKIHMQRRDSRQRVSCAG